MDSPHMNTSPLQNFGQHVRKLAIAAGYPLDIVNSGAITRLAADAGMSQSTISKLLAGQRMPEAQYFVGLAKAIGTDPIDLFVESGILPPETRSQSTHKAVTSPPITPDDVADAWDVDEFGREMVHAMFQRLTNPQPNPPSRDDIGGAEAQ